MSRVSRAAWWVRRQRAARGPGVSTRTSLYSGVPSVFFMVDAAAAFITALKQCQESGTLISANASLGAMLQQARSAYADLIRATSHESKQCELAASVWKLHHAHIDALQVAIKAATRTDASPNDPGAIVAHGVASTALREAQHFFDALLRDIHPDAAAHTASASAQSDSSAEAILLPPSYGMGVEKVAPPRRRLAAQLCVAGGDLRRYESALPLCGDAEKRAFLDGSRRHYVVASRLAPDDGRPHNCLGVLSQATAANGFIPACGFVRAMSCKGNSVARKNARSNLSLLLLREQAQQAKQQRRQPRSGRPAHDAQRAATSPLDEWSTSVLCALAPVVLRADQEKVHTRAVAALRAWREVPMTVSTPQMSRAAQNGLTLLIFAVHEAARKATETDATAPLPSLVAPPEPPHLLPPVFFPVLTLVLKSLAHAVKRLERHADALLPHVAMACSWLAARHWLLTEAAASEHDQNAPAELLAALSTHLNSLRAPDPLPWAVTPTTERPADIKRAQARLLPEEVEAAGFLPFEQHLGEARAPTNVAPAPASSFASRRRHERIWQLAAVCVRHGLLFPLGATGELSTRSATRGATRPQEAGAALPKPPPAPPAPPPAPPPGPPIDVSDTYELQQRPPMSTVPSPGCEHRSATAGTSLPPEMAVLFEELASLSSSAFSAITPAAVLPAAIPSPAIHPITACPPTPTEASVTASSATNSLATACPAAAAAVPSSNTKAPPHRKEPQPRAARPAPRIANQVQPAGKPLIVIDGPNVAIKHGQRTRFSCRGIQLVIEYWQAAGHRTLAFVPDSYLNFDRAGGSKRAASLGLSDAKYVADDVPLLRTLEARGDLVVTPPQDYDDSYAIAYARDRMPACIVTNDMYRDYVESEGRRGRSKKEADEWRREHLISFTFILDEFLPNPDFVFPRST